MVATPAVDLNAVLATKADLANLATKGDVAEIKASIRELAETMTSGFNLAMGEIGKLKASVEETNRVLGGLVSTSETHGTMLARVVSRLDGVPLDTVE